MSAKSGVITLFISPLIISLYTKNQENFILHKCSLKRSNYLFTALVNASNKHK